MPLRVFCLLPLLVLALPGCLTLATHERTRSFLEHVDDPRPPETVARLLGCAGSPEQVTLRVRLTDDSVWDMSYVLQSYRSFSGPRWSKVSEGAAPLEDGVPLLVTYAPLGHVAIDVKPGVPVHRVRGGAIDLTAHTLTSAARARMGIVSLDAGRLAVIGEPFGAPHLLNLSADLGEAGPDWKVPRFAGLKAFLVRVAQPFLYAVALGLDATVLGGPLVLQILESAGVLHLGPMRF